MSHGTQLCWSRTPIYFRYPNNEGPHSGNTRYQYLVPPFYFLKFYKESWQGLSRSNKELYSLDH